MVKRSNIKLTADPTRVLLRFLYPGNDKRVKNIIDRVLRLSEDEAEKNLDKIKEEFSYRHRDFEKLLLYHFEKVNHLIPKTIILSGTRKLLTGAYFSMEYSIESAALFNPSIVPHPDQASLKEGELRFIMSLRSVGEGHISSITFRTGIIDSNDEIRLDDISRYVSMAGKREEKVQVTFDIADELTREANYNIFFLPDVPLTERVIFPFSRTEQNGIEDVRFVKFINDNGSAVYYGTFTAYDGHRILTELIETEDFIKFKIRTLNGNKVADKGMALFPRKINGKYTFISRLDGENLYFMQSDNIYEWNSAEVMKIPSKSWEFVQLGNCGSPIETSGGWVLITHSVGPLRRYVISALLLDKHNPSKVIGTLNEPLIEPSENEREGYVPNVVYSCGSLIHNNSVFIPYAMSDSASSIASINLDALLRKFISC